MHRPDDAPAPNERPFPYVEVSLGLPCLLLIGLAIEVVRDVAAAGFMAPLDLLALCTGAAVLWQLIRRILDRPASRAVNAALTRTEGTVYVLLSAALTGTIAVLLRAVA